VIDNTENTDVHEFYFSDMSWEEAREWIASRRERLGIVSVREIDRKSTVPAVQLVFATTEGLGEFIIEHCEIDPSSLSTVLHSIVRSKDTH
jgi:hypothetical protein